jgi:hypothetical protein
MGQPGIVSGLGGREGNRTLLAETEVENYMKFPSSLLLPSHAVVVLKEKKDTVSRLTRFYRNNGSRQSPLKQNLH